MTRGAFSTDIKTVLTDEICKGLYLYFEYHVKFFSCSKRGKRVKRSRVAGNILFDGFMLWSTCGSSAELRKNTN